MNIITIIEFFIENFSYTLNIITIYLLFHFTAYRVLQIWTFSILIIVFFIKIQQFYFFKFQIDIVKS